MAEIKGEITKTNNRLEEAEDRIEKAEERLQNVEGVLSEMLKPCSNGDKVNRAGEPLTTSKYPLMGFQKGPKRIVHQ